MIKALMMAIVIAMFSLLLAAPSFAVSGGDMVKDGSYDVDGGKPENDGVAAVTDGGKKITYVSESGYGATWTWDSSTSTYVHDDDEDLSLTCTDDGSGDYKWVLHDGGNEADSGTMTN